MSRRTLIIANWKMNLTTHECSVLLHRLNEHIENHRNVEVVLAPSFVSLQPMSTEMDRRKFRLAAQNAYYKDEGAYTGEVSFTQLRDLVHYVIVGHSERRTYFNETLPIVRDKVTAAVRNEIQPILCIGETLEERKNGETKQVIHDQLTTAIRNLTSEEIENVIIAYEPLWAITTFGNQIAKPSEINDVIKQIRYQVYELYGKTASEKVKVIYGGHVDEQLIGGYLDIDGCDGALVGAASLNWHKFSQIVRVAQEHHFKA